MANGIVTPPDYRAANAITGFTEGLKSGVGIVKDVQDIKSRKTDEARKKTADERRKVVEGREDTEWGQSQEDRKNKAYQEFLDRQEQMMTGYTRAIRVNPEAALDIREAMLTAGGSKKKLREKPTFVDVDGGFEIHEKYDDGTEQIIPADYVKDAYNKWPSKTQGTINPDDKANYAMKALDQLDNQIESLQKEAKDLYGDEKKAVTDKIAILRKRRPALEKQAKDLSGVSMGEDEEAPATEAPAAGGVPAAAPVAPTKAPGVLGRIKNVFTGELGGPDAAPVTTTGPGTSGTAPQRMTNPNTGQIIIVKDGQWVDEKTGQPVK